MSRRRARATTQPEAARDALYDVGVIQDILATLAAGEISGVEGIPGTSIAYLADRLAEAIEQIEPVVHHLPARR